MHIVFDSRTQIAKLFRKDGQLEHLFPMRDAAVHGPGFGRWGRCPRGTYRLGPPIETEDPALGRHFTPLLSVPGRHGIGIHGGGTGSPYPFDPHQGWIPTHGCLRVQNTDNDRLVRALKAHDEPHLITLEGP